ncbi:hypothetical protein [[Clostridium] colinum]|uniref:hypothetical protein n=1 Tax=[Clostridium] colinum TaxID=36835 RepID=UPI002023D2B3|nr:hypothetical protein [[Clostridium] colinum]
MKIRLIIISAILCLTFVGCGKKNVDNTTQMEETQEIEQIEQEEENLDINIFTKNNTIEYKLFVSEDDNFENDISYMEMPYDFISRIEEGSIITIPYDEEIRLDFNNNLPKDKKVEFSKIFINKNGETDIENLQPLQINENGFADFKHTYDKNNNEIEGVIYEITSKGKEDKFYRYCFAIKIDNQPVKENNIKTVTGYLSPEEQKTYELYKQAKEQKSLVNLEPITISKFYAQAIMEKDYDLAYSFYNQDSNVPKKDEFIKIMQNLDENTKQQYVDNMKSVSSGKFIKENEQKGYIEYELNADHLMAIDVVKDSNEIWKIAYLPIQ